VLAVRNLRKSYGRGVLAVDGVSFSVEPGQMVGLLGPNGAGKSTTVAMIAGLVTPDSGEVTVAGAPLAGDTDAKKRLIGLVPQDLALYDELPAAANLPCSARSTGWPAARSRTPSARRCCSLV